MKINHLFKIIILISLGSFSCQKQEKFSSQSTQEESVAKLQPISTDVTMVKVEGGRYLPFYGSDTSLVTVQPFLIDERPVTNAEFLAFIKANPQWQRSKIKRLYADETYLKDWLSDTELPKDAKPDAPVTFVSWFAAKAYADAVGKRLPTLDEWEFVAMADEASSNARDKKTYTDKILNLYLVKDRQFKSVKQSAPNYWGVYNMFDLIWEWTDDFNSVMVTGDSRTSEFDDKNLFCAGAATSATDVLNYAAFMRFGFRSSLKANYTVANLGFRCVKDIEK